MRASFLTALTGARKCRIRHTTCADRRIRTSLGGRSGRGFTCRGDRFQRVTNIDAWWDEQAVYVTSYVTLSSTMKIRFSAADVPNNSKDEAGVDAVEFFDVVCE